MTKKKIFTIAGIAVGAVIVILSLGNGMTNMMNSQFEKMGSNLIQVMTYGRRQRCAERPK